MIEKKKEIHNSAKTTTTTTTKTAVQRTRVPVLEKMASLVRRALRTLDGREVVTELPIRSSIDVININENCIADKSNFVANRVDGFLARCEAASSGFCNRTSLLQANFTGVAASAAVRGDVDDDDDDDGGDDDDDGNDGKYDYSSECNGSLAGRRKGGGGVEETTSGSAQITMKEEMEQEEEDVEEKGKPETKMRNIGTNVHPEDLPRRRGGRHYVIRYRGLTVAVSDKVRLADLKKLGKERVRVPKLRYDQINKRKNSSDGSRSSGKKAMDQSHRNEVKENRTESTKKWTLQTNDDRTCAGLKIRFKAEVEKSSQQNLTQEKRKTSKTRRGATVNKESSIALSRSKRLKVDYKPHAFSHILKFDVSPEGFNAWKKLHSDGGGAGTEGGGSTATCARQKCSSNGMNANRFKGCRSMRVQLRRCKREKREKEEGKCETEDKKMALKIFLKKNVETQKETEQNHDEEDDWSISKDARTSMRRRKKRKKREKRDKDCPPDIEKNDENDEKDEKMEVLEKEIKSESWIKEENDEKETATTDCDAESAFDQIRLAADFNLVERKSVETFAHRCDDMEDDEGQDDYAVLLHRSVESGENEDELSVHSDDGVQHIYDEMSSASESLTDRRPAEGDVDDDKSGMLTDDDDTCPLSDDEGRADARSSNLDMDEEDATMEEDAGPDSLVMSDLTDDEGDASCWTTSMTMTMTNATMNNSESTLTMPELPRRQESESVCSQDLFPFDMSVENLRETKEPNELERKIVEDVVAPVVERQKDEESKEKDDEFLFEYENISEVSSDDEDSRLVIAEDEEDVQKATPNLSLGIQSFYCEEDEEEEKEKEDDTVSKSLSSSFSTEEREEEEKEKKKKTEFVYVWNRRPPSRKEIEETLKDFGIPSFRHQDAFFSRPEDDPQRKRTESIEDDGEKNEFQLQGLENWRTIVATQFADENCQDILDQLKQNRRMKAALLSNRRSVVLVPHLRPPPRKEVEEWSKRKGRSKETAVTKVAKIVEEEKASCESPVPSFASPSSQPLHSTPQTLHRFSPGVSPLCTPVLRKRPWQKRKLEKVVEEEEDEEKMKEPEPKKNKTEETNAMQMDNHEEEDDEEQEIIDLRKNRTKWTKHATQLSSGRNSVSPLTLSSKGYTSTSQIDAPTPANTHGFKVQSLNLQDAKAINEHQYLTICSLELHVETRENLLPDPEKDAVAALFYSIHNDIPEVDGIERNVNGCIVVEKNVPSGCNCCSSKEATELQQDGETKLCCQSCQNLKQHLLARTGIVNVHTLFVPDETKLLEEVVTLVRMWDPDVLVGYEVETLSWGFLLQRSRVINMNLDSLLSRVPRFKKNPEFFEFDNESEEQEIRLRGRIVLNLWRLMRHEVPLTVYRFENVAFHLLHQRIPLYSFRSLTEWFRHSSHLLRWRTIEHYVIRTHANIQLLLQVDLIGRTSELARLFGIQFYEVLSRGSQFRVESMMLRLIKPKNYIAVSPSVQQRAQMRAPQSLPLIMEPESKFYSNPIIVLDFQSLYPSMMIAYNYCYSTCLGDVNSLGRSDAFRFGCTSLKIPPAEFLRLKNDIHISPEGIAFVKANVRKGILPQMLEEILETRIMVKKAMKSYKGDKSLLRVLDARQLGLKLIANVSYGYTAANYSGRMPCSEVADSVVSKARETLERAIRMVNNNPKWDAKVVYGDTDSLFVHLPGRSKDEAFIIGQEIAEEVTADNPKPVKLKFEKVYLPCVLQTKKRYVGFMYETPDQEEPIYDAKGIETVRRDGCPALVKVLEKTIRMLFTCRDLSRVKFYVQKQFQKIFSGRVSLQDLTLAREYRGRRGYKPNTRVPALEISKRLLQEDPRAEPRVAQRVPYVIVYGSPGEQLYNLIRTPEEVLQDPNLRINAHYYVNNLLIPSLQRVLGLLGVDVRQWFESMPRSTNLHLSIVSGGNSLMNKRGTISQYFPVLNCPVCGDVTTEELCSKCTLNPQNAVVILNEQIRKLERTHHKLTELCVSCSGVTKNISCISLDCPVFYSLAQATKDLNQVQHLRKHIKRLMEF